MLLSLPAPGPGISVYEPHIAIDPANPDRLAVAAQHGVRRGFGGRHLHLWVSDDAGSTWFHTAVPPPSHGPQFSADPLVAFDTSGGLIVVETCAPAVIADHYDALGFTRQTVPSPERLLELMLEGMPPAKLWERDWIGVSRSVDGGRTLSGQLIVGSPGGDKSAIAVDRYATSPRYGSVYVLWADITRNLRIARSTDHGATFNQPATIECWATSHGAQIVALPDGSVHVVWTLNSPPGAPTMELPRRDGAPPNARSVFYHSISTDGGVGFCPPTVIGTHRGPGHVGLPAVAADNGGRIMLVWGQADTLPNLDARPVIQPRHQLYGMLYDGKTWSSPRPLCPRVARNSHFGLPAVTSDGDTWRILTYVADEELTRVVELTSAAMEPRFELDRVLAARAIGVDDISLMGSYLHRLCDDVAGIGDYIGIAAAHSRVVSTFILPATDLPTDTATAYVAIN